jgi:primosomal protein N'
MFVTEVIPLRRGIGIETLSYFGSDAFPVGTLLKIPVRNQTILGLVSSVEEVSAAKTALKAATFSLRKIPTQDSIQSLSPAYVETAKELALLYGTTVGNVLFSLLPPVIQNGEVPLPHVKPCTVKEHFIPEVLQAKRDERWVTYRSIVRETFAHASSVLIVVPTSIEALELKKALGRGIEDRIIFLTGTEGKRALREAYALLEDFTHAKLIIATPSHAVIERHDIARVILEDARSPHYKERTRPYLDHRDVQRIHAHHTGRILLMSDILIRTEEEHARRAERLMTYGETPKRMELPGKLTILFRDKVTEKEKPFALFSPEARALIDDVKKKKRRLFIFSARRGLAPIVTCAQCTHIFRSEVSGAPYSLLRTMKNGVEERWFVSGISGERIRAADICPECQSWKLRERGIGIQHIYDELKQIARDTPTFVFDHTTATTWKKALAVRDGFYGAKSGILLGTSMSLPYLTEPIDNALITSMDALLTTPTWRLEEENLALILRLREVTKEAVYIESRTKEHELFGYARHGEVERFYTDEIELRKSMLYPPFSHFIHLTWQASIPEAREIEKKVHEHLDTWNVSIYQSPLIPKGGIVLHGLIRIPAASWPDRALSESLRLLPPSIRIVHNPDRLV